MKVLLASAYWPNLHYFHYVLNWDEVLIEMQEHYVKQSYRNRCHLLSANGMLALQIPVKHKQQKQTMKEVAINYSERWQARHWGAITSAYRNSPFFDFFETEIAAFYQSRFDLLGEYNTQQLEFLLRVFKIKKNIQFTTEYFEQADGKDLRDLIHPKKDYSLDAGIRTILDKPYYQTFESKFPFTPNLSVLDLLFNTGLNSLDYLKSPVSV